MGWEKSDKIEFLEHTVLNFAQGTRIIFMDKTPVVDLSQISEQVLQIRKGASKGVEEGSWIDMVANTELRFKSSGRLKVSKGVSIKKTQPGPLAHLAESETLKYLELEYNPIPLQIFLA